MGGEGGRDGWGCVDKLMREIDQQEVELGGEVLRGLSWEEVMGSRIGYMRGRVVSHGQELTRREASGTLNVGVA